MTFPFDPSASGRPGEPPTVAILGGGAGGSLVATQLLRHAERPVRIVVVERGGSLARGVAYGTPFSSHLLNVPAGRMSALEDDPSHFVRWIARQEPPHGLGQLDFAPRALYGDYLEATLRDAIAAARPGVEFHGIEDEAIRLAVGSAGATLHLHLGPPLAAASVVLAIGNPPQADPASVAPDLLASDLWRSDPWAPRTFEGIPSEGSVLLLGTGLTMVDAVLALDEVGHRGRRVALSRRGLLPRVHVCGSVAKPWIPPPGPWPPSVREGLRQIRRLAAGSPEAEGGWRSAIDGFREITQRIWLDLPLDEKRRFLRHVQPYWDVHRHRMAPRIAERLRALEAAGHLTFLAGRMDRLEKRADAMDLFWIPRGGSRVESLRGFSAAINCTGPQFGRAAEGLPLLRDLLERGIVRADPLGLGLDATPEGRLLGVTGEPSDLLFTLGPPLKGVLWETIAIPEVRVQAERIARLLLDSRSLRTQAV